MSPTQQADFCEWLQAHSAFKGLRGVSLEEGQQSLSAFKVREQQLAQENMSLKSTMRDLQGQIAQLTQDNNQLSQENHRQQGQFHPTPLALAEDKELVVVTSQSKKFHQPDCYYLIDVAPQFKTTKTKGEAIAAGGRACRTCCP